MKYIDEFRNKKLIFDIAKEIKKVSEGANFTFMEVCGTHTMSIFKFGLKDILPKNIKLLSGPGCPVCVTSQNYLDEAIYFTKIKDFIITSFGDMIRVPGTSSSLEKEKAKGADIRVVYSCLDALDIAINNPKKKVLFLSIGFETTTPTIAATVLEAKKGKIKNFHIMAGNKMIPPAMELLVKDPDLRLDGFICPGHVSAIIGSKPYNFIAEKHNLPCVVSGFEPIDIIHSILLLLKQRKNNKAKVEIQYKRVVTANGNKKAQRYMKKVFKIVDSDWRGIGNIPKSGHSLRNEFKNFDVKNLIKPKIGIPKENKGCICGQVLRGIKTPLDCKLFRKACSPTNPVGACMVSSEGTCAAYYKYSP